MQASRLYEKVGDFFDTPYTLFKAAECGFFLKDYETAIERFVKAADGALERASPLRAERLRICTRLLQSGRKRKGKKVTDLKKRIAEVKENYEVQPSD